MKKEHILIVGGSKGSGRALVQTMVQRGYRVSVISRNPPPKKIAKARYWQADITAQGDFLKVYKEIIRKQGPLNHLVFSQQYRGSGDDWSGQTQTSLTAVKNVIESAINDFENVKGRNTIVLVSSIAGHLIASEQPVGYHVAKAGLEQMTRYYAVVLGPKGIRVNAVAPNMVLKEENKEFYARNKKIHDLYASISPIRRMVASEDIAHTIGFFCSVQSAGINGQVLVVDGGVSLQEHAGMARALASLDSVHITQKNYKQKKLIK